MICLHLFTGTQKWMTLIAIIKQDLRLSKWGVTLYWKNITASWRASFKTAAYIVCVYRNSYIHFHLKLHGSLQDDFLPDKKVFSRRMPMGFYLHVEFFLLHQCPQKGDKQKKVYSLEGTIPMYGKFNISIFLWCGILVCMFSHAPKDP